MNILWDVLAIAHHSLKLRVLVSEFVVSQDAFLSLSLSHSRLLASEPDCRNLASAKITNGLHTYMATISLLPIAIAV